MFDSECDVTEDRRLDALLTDEELAELLRCTVRTLQNRRRRGAAPPSVKIGGSRRTPLPWCEQWLMTRAQISA
jgi:hypothetical protein